MQLISLKARRERTIRAALSALAREESELLAERERLASERAALCDEWRRRSEIGDVLHQNSLQDLKMEFSDYYLAERGLVDRLDASGVKLDELRKDRHRHEQALRQAVAGQEKLKLLME
ncbi:MAG: hypothetical protein QOI13_1200 [Paraburkholderia sp.]|nr:hypothetical protein [Paraburkholderia sp.]MEA3121622.1 hypothetical protein [Paraburkholderia sp.]